MSDIGDFKDMVGAFVGAQGATTAASEQAGCGCCTDLRQPPASEQQASVSELPPLPEPTVFKNEGTVYGYEVRAFTLDQMQGYARAALSGRATIRSEADELAPVSFDTWFDDMPEKERMRILLSGDRMVALNAWQAALTHRATTAPAGYKLVPVEPTPEMYSVMLKWGTKRSEWEGILAAAPDTATTAADQQGALLAEMVKMMDDGDEPGAGSEWHTRAKAVLAVRQGAAQAQAGDAARYRWLLRHPEHVTWGAFYDCTQTGPSTTVSDAIDAAMAAPATSKEPQ